MTSLDPARPAWRPHRKIHWGTVAVAAVPLAALALFFVYPVAGMLALGLCPDGTFDPGGVAEVLARPRVHRVLWFTVWSAGAATVLVGGPGAPGRVRAAPAAVPGS